jgi:hypothetical protein
MALLFIFVYMKSKLVLKRSEIEGNPYQMNTIEFIEFNFDGNGSALVSEDNQLTYRNKTDVHEILFGGREIKKIFYSWYLEVKAEMEHISIH